MKNGARRYRKVLTVQRRLITKAFLRVVLAGGVVVGGWWVSFGRDDYAFAKAKKEDILEGPQGVDEVTIPMNGYIKHYRTAKSVFEPACYQKGIAAYKCYLESFSNGRHRDEAERRIAELKQAAIWANQRQALIEVANAPSWGEARRHIRQVLDAHPVDIGLLLQMALLAWGFDRFHHQAWEESWAYIEKVAALDPRNELLEAVKTHNQTHAPMAQKAARNCGD